MKENDLIVLGREGSNGNFAAQRLLDRGWFPNWETPQIKFVPSNGAILHSVNAGRSNAYGLVPIENGSGGLVSEVIQYWMNMERKINVDKRGVSPRLRVIGEITIPVEHFLLVHPTVKRISQLEVICSHPQAIVQCSNNIARIKFTDKTRATLSTAEAAFKASCSPSVGALASAFAGRLNGLTNLRRMHDFSGNATRFHIVAKSESHKAFIPNGRTAVILWLRDKPGAFASVADLFREHDINMSSLHAIPLGRLNSYSFYLEFDEFIGLDEGSPLFEELSKRCRKLLILGSYQKELK